MGVVEFEQNRLRQQEIEVQALVALLRRKNWAKKAERRLVKIAFPEEVAEKINGVQETLTINGNWVQDDL